MSASQESSQDIYVRNEDLENYFANTIIPQLFIDANFILRKFTPPAMKHFSLSEADINRNIHEVKDNIRYPTLIENINEVMTTGEILEKEVQTTDGRWFQMNILPYLIRREKRTNGVIITFVDITERIHNLKELEKLNADHDTLMYALAHDIRQPLAAITLLADGLTQAYNQRKTEQFNKWIQQLKSSSSTMKTMISDFTHDNESRPESTKEDERVNIENIVKDVITALKGELYAKGVSIRTELSTSEIIFSRKNLRSIVYNLISNAIKFRDPDRPLELAVTTKKLERHVLFQIRDNGLGIAKDDHEKVFMKTSRLNPQIEGTGMGLYIIKRMVENNEGRVEVQSEPGKGSVFSIYFKSHYPGQQ